MRKRLIITSVIAGVLLVGLILFLVKEKPVSIRKRPGGVIDQGYALLEEGDLIGARKLLQHAFKEAEDAQTLEALKATIEELNIKILFSSIMDECSAEYVVKPKDALIKIAHRFGTTVALIKKANGLQSDIIKPGQRLKVHVCPFSIAVDKSQNFLFLKRNGVVLKSYIVATGKDNSTPVGKFKVTNKLVNPTWFKTGAVVAPDSPENILGSRWMGLDLPGYGIHGSRDVNQIGQQVTQGCVRMKNEHVEELYDIVPIGTEIIIID